MGRGLAPAVAAHGALLSLRARKNSLSNQVNASTAAAVQPTSPHEAYSLPDAGPRSGVTATYCRSQWRHRGALYLMSGIAKIYCDEGDLRDVPEH